jgi:hypothetical protein
MTRTTRRTWSRAGMAVSTVHPQYGELYRGRIRSVRTDATQVCGSWDVVDQDSVHHGVVVGDYRDAEALLMRVTAWADEPAGTDF